MLMLFFGPVVGFLTFVIIRISNVVRRTMRLLMLWVRAKVLIPSVFVLYGPKLSGCNSYFSFLLHT